MSLGWQGESALLPKRSKAIRVDSTSMQRLQAEVFEGQQRRGADAYKDSRLRERRGLSSRVHDRVDVFARENRGVREREARDKEASKAMRFREDKITSALTAKAELYDRLRSGIKTANDKDGEGSSDDVLVDFGKKKEVEMAHKNSSNDFAEDNGEVSDMSDIEDEFGRHRRVRRSSQEYRDWKTKHSSDSRANDYKKAEESDHQCSTEDGLVRSQWERQVLRGTERDHLNAVHEHTEAVRRMNQKPLIEKRKRQEESGGGDASDAREEKGSHMSAVEKRREMLRQKQLAFKKQKSSST